MRGCEIYFEIVLAFCWEGAYHNSLRSKERLLTHIAGWSSLVARRAHNPEVVGSNPAPATKTPSLTCINGQAFLLTDIRPTIQPTFYRQKISGSSGKSRKMPFRWRPYSMSDFQVEPNALLFLSRSSARVRMSVRVLSLGRVRRALARERRQDGKEEAEKVLQTDEGRARRRRPGGRLPEAAVVAALFRRLFGLMLTDNGPEFSDLEAIERSALGAGPRCRVYYCDARQSQQKGGAASATTSSSGSSCPKGGGLLRHPRRARLRRAHEPAQLRAAPLAVRGAPLAAAAGRRAGDRRAARRGAGGKGAAAAAGIERAR